MLDLWTRIQLAKVHFGMGSLKKGEYCAVLGHLCEEATR